MRGPPDLMKCNDFMGITPSYWKCYWQISDMCENSIRRGYSRIEDLSDKLPSVFVNLLVWKLFYFCSWGRVEKMPVYIIATNWKPSLTLLRLKCGHNTINSKAGFHKVPPTPTLVLSSSLKIATSSIACVSSRPRSKMLTTAGLEQVHKYKWHGSPLARKSPIQHPHVHFSWLHTQYTSWHRPRDKKDLSKYSLVKHMSYSWCVDRSFWLTYNNHRWSLI